MRAIQNVTFVEFEPMCQKLWAFKSSFAMTTHQIWSCHVTLATNFKKIYFFPNSVLNFRKVTKFGGNWLKNKKVTDKKQNSGWKTPLLQCWKVRKGGQGTSGGKVGSS